jgi:hypothetical protein
MQCANLTDDDLWSGIAQNTNAMSLLFEEHRELKCSRTDSAGSSGLRHSRQLRQVTDIARRLMRGGELNQEEGASS